MRNQYGCSPSSTIRTVIGVLRFSKFQELKLEDSRSRLYVERRSKLGYKKKHVDQGKLGKLRYGLLGWETFFDSYNQNKN